MGRLFALEESGYFYTRLQNPTNDAVAAKICDLEGGVAAMLTSSGQAANFYAIMNICGRRRSYCMCICSYMAVPIICMPIQSKRWVLMLHLLIRSVRQEELDAAFQRKYKSSIWRDDCQSGSCCIWIWKNLQVAAHAHGVPFIVDNTFATPINCRPFEWGADIVTHSTTKYMDGHAACVGGAIVDSGNFDWAAHADKFPGLTTPDETYHGIVYTEKFGKGAYITKATAQLMRDLRFYSSHRRMHLF